MNSLYVVVPASIRHIKPLSAHLRPAACLTLRDLGFDARCVLRQAFLSSNYSRTALIDGTPVAMWGTVSPMLSDHATVWAALGDGAVRWPLAVVRRARAELAEMYERYGVLYATMFQEDERAMAFAKTLGFTEQSRATDDQLLMAFRGK